MTFLLLLTMILVALGLWAGLASVFDIQDRADRLDDVTQRSNPVSVAALEIFKSLSKADSALAEAFLTSGSTPTELDERYRAELDERYRAAITRTVEALHTATAFGASTGYPRPAVRVASTGDPDVTVCGAPTGDSHVTAVAELSNCLQAYTGLVETARTYNRQGLPQGAVYLRTASELVRNTMLPIARKLYEDETEHKTAEQDRASEWSWRTLTPSILMFVFLVGVQLYLMMRTKRRLNPFLAAATASIIAGVILLSYTWADARRHIETSQREGTEQVSAFVELRTAALQARAVEALTLVSRGNGAEFETQFDDATKRLAGPDGALARAKALVSQHDTRRVLDAAAGTLTRWIAVHDEVYDEVRRLDDESKYLEVIRKVTGSEPGNAASLAGDFDSYLGQALDLAEEDFDTAVQDARDALNGVVVALAFLFLGVSVLLALAGMWVRIVEYLLPVNDPRRDRLTVVTAAFTVVAFAIVVFASGCGADAPDRSSSEHPPAAATSLAVPRPEPAGVQYPEEQGPDCTSGQPGDSRPPRPGQAEEFTCCPTVRPNISEPDTRCFERASFRPSTLPLAAQLSTPKLAEIRGRGYLRVGVSLAGYLLGFHDPRTGTMEGFEIDIARAVARDIFGDSNKIQFVEVNVANLTAVNSDVDILLSAISMSRERWQEVAFSTEYLTGGQRVLVSRDSTYDSLDDLGGKKVCASTKSVNIAAIEQTESDPIPVTAANTADCMVLLQQGVVDAVSTGEIILAGLAAQDKSTHAVGPRLTDAPVGVVISHDAIDLVRFVNGVLERIRSSGEWDRLYAKWVLPSLGPAAPPTPQYRD